jgi:hypothetical protein
VNKTFVAWLARTGRTLDPAQHDIALEAWNAAVDAAASLCLVEVERKAGYGGSFGGYGNFKDDKTGPECASDIRSRLTARPTQGQGQG